MNIEREAKRTAYKPLVFICSPFAGNIERNTRRAREFCRFAVSENCIPIAPHLLFPQFMEGKRPGSSAALASSSGWSYRASARRLWVFGGNITKGMAVEIEKAHERGLPVRHFTERCVEVVRK